LGIVAAQQLRGLLFEAAIIRILERRARRPGIFTGGLGGGGVVKTGKGRLKGSGACGCMIMSGDGTGSPEAPRGKGHVKGGGGCSHSTGWDDL